MGSSLFQLYFIVITFLLGSVPTGMILSVYLARVDVRKAGSGNIGATNVARLIGKKLGLVTLLGDALKGALPVALSLWVMDGPVGVSVVALAAFLGHCYSIFLGFNGGKGVAVAFGDFLVLAPWAALLALAVWLTVVLVWRKSSLGALIAAPSMLLTILIEPAYRVYAPFTGVLVAILVLRHRENISRLLRGSER